MAAAVSSMDRRVTSMIGQLWRGNASCSMPREAGGWDEFGRFDVTYPLAAPWLGPIEPAGPADINKDGVINVADIISLITYLK